MSYEHDGVSYGYTNVGPRAQPSEWCVQSDVNPNWWRNPTTTYSDPTNPEHQWEWSCRHAEQNWPSKVTDGYPASGFSICDECGDGPFDPQYATVTDEQMDEARVGLIRLLESMER